MTERDTRIRELYEAALKKPIGERASFVERQAGGDLELRRQVEALLGGQQETQLPGYEPATGALLETGTLIGSYRIDGPLGAGGWGGVPGDGHQAPPSGSDQSTAGDLGGSRSAPALSARSAVGLLVQPPAHRDGVRRGEYQERQYLITEYVDGDATALGASRPRGWRPIVELLIGVADGIATAHEAGSCTATSSPRTFCWRRTATRS